MTRVNWVGGLDGRTELWTDVIVAWKLTMQMPVLYAGFSSALP